MQYIKRIKIVKNNDVKTIAICDSKGVSINVGIWKNT